MIHRTIRYLVVLAVLLVTELLVVLPRAAVAQSAELEKHLLSSNPTVLFESSVTSGNAMRGAILFHGPLLGCGKCHAVSDNGIELLGPNLAKQRPGETGEALVESILRPSAKVAVEYQSMRVLTTSGQVITGLRLPQSDSQTLVLRTLESLQDATVATDEIEEQQLGKQSIMPEGTVRSLANEAEFFDLISYVLAIRDGGAKRARELQPTSAQLAIKLPDYESNIDHAGMIQSWDEASLERGKSIYAGLCVNCHGTKDAPGSLATALRFGEGKFKVGSDPYSLYQTLTRGAGLMMPQPWMVPQQKYDVIHYLRKEFLEGHNPAQLTDISGEYLASLPPGNDRGPEPQKIEPWSQADYGPRLIGTYEIGSGSRNIAQKGIAIQLDDHPGGIAHGQAWAIFDHDTMRVAGVWSSGGFIDWRGIHFNGSHNIHPHIAGDILLSNPTGPGWAQPETGSWDDTSRVLGRDGKWYGPLPRSWAQFTGIQQVGRQSVVDYRVGKTSIRESFSWSDVPVPNSSTLGRFSRHIAIGGRAQPLELLVATLDHPSQSWTINDGLAHAKSSQLPKESTSAKTPNQFDGTHYLASKIGQLVAGFDSQAKGLAWIVRQRQLILQIPAGDSEIHCSVWSAMQAGALEGEQEKQVIEALQLAESVEKHRLDSSQPAAFRSDFGPPLFPEVVVTEVELGGDQGGFAVDVLKVPTANPWQVRMRLSGLDFFNDPDRLAVCTWDGDVWIVSGIAALDQPATSAKLTWRRVAFGLFQPLGLKIIDEQIYLTCRDQLVRLDDRNDDGEIDYYHCVNNDHQVTEHFHEFAMGLQTDAAGNFYYAKSARHALPALVPHHGTLLRVSKDGSKTDILAKGFRAANGVCLNPDGSFIVTDQEGHWNPKNRINWVEPGGFYGNMYGYHEVTDESDSAMVPPLCWITNKFDRSPAELLWVDSPAWGPLQGTLLNFSYGYGRVYVVPHEFVNGQVQGGMCALPINDLPTGTMRARFSPFDGQLYLCGLSAWATNQTLEEGGLYRIRYLGTPAALPLQLSAKTAGLEVRFSEPLSPATSLKAEDYAVEAWSLLRTKNYGSEHYDQHALEITSVSLSEDRTLLTLTIPDIQPTWCMEIRLPLVTSDGRSVERVIHNTIHNLAP